MEKVQLEKLPIKNLPDTTYPANAQTINAIQDNVGTTIDEVQNNVETSINEIKTNTETAINEVRDNVENVFNGNKSMGSIVVEDIECKNMFDKSLITSKTDTVKYIPITVEKNTDYTLSTNSGTETQAHVFLTRSASGASSANNGAMINKPRTVNSADKTTMYVGYNSDLTNYWIQLEKGTVATSYTPHKKFDNTEYVLFDGSSNGDLTLIDSITNYSKLKIMGIGLDFTDTYTEITNPLVGKNGQLFSTVMNEDGMYSSVLTFTLNDSSFTKKQNYNCVCRGGTYQRYAKDENKITKVVGYK